VRSKNGFPQELFAQALGYSLGWEEPFGFLRSTQ